MDDSDSIIVFQHFDNSIDANIVKTKLDAFGIPCFITEENISNLYPSNNFITGGIRLHIFETDRERVREILSERFLSEDDELSRCPRCRSKNVERDISRKIENNLPRFLFSLFILLVPQHRVNRCQDCEFEF